MFIKPNGTSFLEALRETFFFPTFFSLCESRQPREVERSLKALSFSKASLQSAKLRFKMWCSIRPSFFLLLLLLPGLQLRILDVKKLALLLDNNPFFGDSNFRKGVSAKNYSSHNISSCAFRFHDYAFLAIKEVILNETVFKGHTRCSVEFFNLPKGILRLSLLDEHLHISQR